MSFEINEKELKEILQKKLIEAYLDYAVMFGFESANEVVRELYRKRIDKKLDIWSVE